MKFILPSFLFFVFTVTMSHAKKKKFEVYIQKTGIIVEDEVEVNVSSDDAEQENDEMDDLYDDDLDMGYGYKDASEINIVNAGLRFRDIAIPAGSTIDSAFINVHSHEGQSADDVALITITGENNVDTETFSINALHNRLPAYQRIGSPGNCRRVRIVHQTQHTRHQRYYPGNCEPRWLAGGDVLLLILEGENQGVREDENARELESFENIADPEDGGDGQQHPE
jgi:hypothetical protein